MTAVCFPPIRGTAMRLTRLNAAGVPVVGPCSQIVTDGFITATASPQYDEGTEVAQRNAGGKLCIYEPPRPALTRWDFTVQFCGINPDAYSMMAGYDVLLDNHGASVGVDFSEDVELSLGVGVEIWTDIASGETGSGGVVRWGYVLLPWTVGWRATTDVVIQNDTVNGTLAGRTKRGSPWGTGPYDVVLNGTSPAVAGPMLEPVGATTHMRLLATEVAPPAIPTECGCTALAA